MKPNARPAPKSRTNSALPGRKIRAERLRSARSGAESDPIKLLHELQVQKVELLMQNEALRHSQDQLERVRDRLLELYELAPVGYLTLDQSRIISEVNLTGCVVLGGTKKELLGLRFERFVAPSDAPAFHLFWRRLGESTVRQSCDLQLMRSGGLPLFVRLNAVAIPRHGRGPAGARLCLTDAGKQNGNDQTLASTCEQMRNLVHYLLRLQEEERSRIAREVHFEFSQALEALNSLLMLAQRQLASGAAGGTEPNVADIFRTMSETIREARAAMQNFVSVVRPLVLDELGLLAAVESHTQELRARTGLEIHVRFSPALPQIKPEVATAIYRIFQEALKNAVRHAQPTRIEVALLKEQDELVLQVRDNGRGISDETAHAPQALGILGMRERAMACAGTLRISGSPSQGTVLTARLPFDSKCRARLQDQ
ncbi:MAG: hypothetical protein HY735_16845 [Verrucomicrobia bacterium]|nr:hypothetical protein [Verrucomicrobiota bacterium]